MKTIISGLTVVLFLMIATSAYSGVLVSEYQSSECQISEDGNKTVYLCDNGDRSKTYDATDCAKVPSATAEAGYVILCKEFKMSHTGYDLPGMSCEDSAIMCLNGTPKQVYNPANGTWECKCPKLSF